MQLPGASVMARKKPDKPAPAPSDDRVAVIVLKGTPEYREWLSIISKDSLIPVASIVRDALAKWAVSRGYGPPPEM